MNTRETGSPIKSKPTSRRPKPRVLIIGLDCLTPQLLFERWADELPTFARLRKNGVWGPLESVDPPITVPAWSCMLSGYSPAQLGLYGFRHRELGSYEKRYFAFSNRVTRPRIWNHLTAAGRSCGLVGVPQTYPPKKLKGYLVSGFLASSTRSIYTFPDPLRDDIEDLVGDYMLDVEDFRSEDKHRILRDIYRMTEKRFTLFRHLLETRPTDFAMIVEIGPDRIHHAFWRFTDPEHRLYEKGNPFENAILDYYKHLDRQLAETLALLDPACHLMVVSDHGARAMEGGFCVNDWLRKHGYLTLKQPPCGQTRFDESLVDWHHTTAWAWGGYYARIFVNLAGREPHGQVPAAEREAFLDRLGQELTAISGPDGGPMNNRILRPKNLAPDGKPRGDPPDLMLYAGDLAYRAVGSVGNAGHFVFENDTGPDDANHAKHGIFIYHGPAADRSLPPTTKTGTPAKPQLRLVDVGPSVLQLLGVAVPNDTVGQPMDFIDAFVSQK